MRVGAIDMLLCYLPLRIARAINCLPIEIVTSASEIRLRKNAAVSLTSGMKSVTFDQSGRICDVGYGIRVTDAELNECIERLTEGSLYSYDEHLSRGFIPLPNGCRAGVCGRLAHKGVWAEIYSVNLRAACFVPNAASELISVFAREGIKSTLVCAPPALGKTTFLKSAAFLLSTGIGIEPTRVGLADERGEISFGINNNGLTDRCVFLPKAEGIELLTRVMSPQVIICDEITANELDSVIEAQSSGVSLIASAHCESVSELRHRGRMNALANAEIFPLCVPLSYDGGYRNAVFNTKELL